MITARGRVLIVGSANMDLVLRTERLPTPGETVAGSDYFEAFGGKGANQAVAAARAGARVALVAAVGEDAFGRACAEQYRREGLDLTHLKIAEDRPTGVAMILVDAEGRNMIAVNPGANAALTEADIAAIPEEVFAAARVVAVQLEIPLATARAALARGRRAGAFTILNPAPAPLARLDRELLGLADLIAPNEIEAERLTGVAVTDDASAASAAAALEAAGAVGAVLITLGARGSFLRAPAWGLGTEGKLFPAPSVKAVDTVAAGDAFIGALAARLARALEKETNLAEAVGEAIEFATTAAALSVTRRGAQPSLATLAEIEGFRRKLRSQI